MRIFARRAVITAAVSDIVVENFTKMVVKDDGRSRVYENAVLVLKPEHRVVVSPLDLWVVERRGDRRHRTLATLTGAKWVV